MTLMREASSLTRMDERAGFGLLHQFLEQSLRLWPDHVAVDIPPGTERPARGILTYAELDAESTALAARLRRSIHGECLVCILLPRTYHSLFIAQLAVLKAGAAYTCLDPSFPDERVQEIIADAAATFVLTNSPGQVRLADCGLDSVEVINVEVSSQPVVVGMEPPSWLQPTNLAYVIYTSGTTGRPKGVMIEHRSIANLVASDLQTFCLTPSDRVAQGSSAAYDSSVEETWLAFAAGATLVVMDDEAARLGPDLIDWLRRERITVFCPPPTLLRATGCEDPESALPDLKLLYVGGEALPRDVVDRWSPGRELVNGYGPTECTVTCLRERVKAGDAITIGKPVSGASAWVLNDRLEEVPSGEQGELCMGGVGLARGYWNRPDLTAGKFIEHPVFGRLYQTGDLVHCDVEGRFFYHGRMDSQVKLRGYRIELGEIESRLAECSGVGAAACRVQGDDDHSVIVAFVVPVDSANPPTAGDLKAALEKTLPHYMVPARIGFLDRLPTTVGGKLNRAALPMIDGAVERIADDHVPPRDPMEARMASAFHQVLGLSRPVSIHDDFFNELGGDSLRAALLVTLLRKDAATSWITVRDIYDSRTVAELAGLACDVSEAEVGSLGGGSSNLTAWPFLVTFAQAAWLVGTLIVGSVFAWWIAFECLPWLTYKLGFVPFVLLAPLLGAVAFVVYTPLAVAAAVVVKRLLIGRYESLRAPVWGSFYLRNWIVQQVVRLVPWGVLEGTVYQHIVLRTLGARIGRRVHIHRGVDLLRGGWDLLEIGDDVTLSLDSAVRLVHLEAGEIVVGPVSLGDGCTLETRAGVASHTVLGKGACLTALSSLPTGGHVPDGERWDGIPARSAGHCPVPPILHAPTGALSPELHGLALIAAKAGMMILIYLPLELLVITACLVSNIQQEQLWAWMFLSTPGWSPWLLIFGIELLAVPLTLVWMAVLARLIGRVTEGTISRWSTAYIRVWLKTGLVDSAGHWLSGALFWPIWLRWSGMNIGRGCEVSTISDVIPELIEIGPETFFADGIYLGGPRIQQGTVALEQTTFGTNTFLGNHVVVPAGQRLPADILLGIATVADDRSVRTGTSWFGHAPFELPRREVVEMNRSLTHEPSAARYWNRLFWEALRFALPLVPLWVLVSWCQILAGAAEIFSTPLFLMLAVPLGTFAAMAFLCLFIVALKWTLLGRVRPGQHALWSCWCSRWDFLYVAWGQYGRFALERLEGTLLLNWYLRAMGVKLGKRVVLGPGFSQVVDPDMIVIEDGATVNAMFQAHTFEDRVLKTDHVIIRRNATLASATVPLYGAEIGERTHVAAHSVIMKREHLLPGLHYEGAPTRTRTRAS
jgi:non-ribosomal peptide synthetase-like protein